MPDLAHSERPSTHQNPEQWPERHVPEDWHELMAEREGFETDFRPQVGSASYGFGKRSAPQ